VEENTVCMMTIVGVGTDGVGCLMFARAATALGLREFSGDEWRKPMPVPFGRGGGIYCSRLVEKRRSKNQLADARAKKKAKVEGHKTNSTADVTHTKSSWWAGGRQKGTTNREPRKTKATAAEALASAGDSEVFRSPIDNKRISKAPASFSQEGRPSRAGQRAAGGKHQQPELDKHLKRKGANCSQSACDTEEKLNEAPTELDRTDSAGKLTNDKDISTLMPQCPNIPSCSKEAEEPPLFLWRGG